MREPPHSLLWDALPGAWAGWFVLLAILGIIVSALAGNERAMKLWLESGYELTALYGTATGLTLAVRRAKPLMDAKADIAVAQAESMRSTTATTASKSLEDQ